jgi:probable HAF family extracellular repeat protein
MQTKLGRDPARGRGWDRRFLYPLVTLYALGSAALADTPVESLARTTYTVIQLGNTSANAIGASINGKDQVAFNVDEAGLTRAKFYDGKNVRDIGTLGGPSVTARSLNDLGQITGSANVNADGSISHAFRWSQAAGMVDLSRGSPLNSAGNAINNKGQVAGNAQLPAHIVHAFVWTPRTAPLDLGAFGPSLSSDATVMNNAGMVAGDAESGSGGPFSLVAFRWTKASGIHTIGTLPSEFTFSTDINAAGHIVGESPFPPGGEPHAFLWTQRGGLRDLGTGSLTRSIALALNDHDVVVGQTLRQFVGPIYGFVWTRTTGLLELKSQSPDVGASANDVNNRSQVVGGIDNHAFVWTRAEGVVDLNTRIPGAPAGLKLLAATKISENGAIVASANTGLVLLVPHCGCSKVAPSEGTAVGEGDGTVQSN